MQRYVAIIIFGPVTDTAGVCDAGRGHLCRRYNGKTEYEEGIKIGCFRFSKHQTRRHASFFSHPYHKCARYLIKIVGSMTPEVVSRALKNNQVHLGRRAVVLCDFAK